MKPPKETVTEGYNRLSTYYRKHFELTHPYKHWIQDLTLQIREEGDILELGCGDGLPVAQLLSTQYNYVGVDISEVQIANAKKNILNGTFLVADMSELNFSQNSFDGIIALYSIIHVPIDEQEKLLRSIYVWLRPNGCFLCTVGFKSWTGTETNWILPGTTMYWSHADAAQYTEWFVSMGFVILQNEFIAEGTQGHTLFLLQKPLFDC